MNMRNVLLYLFVASSIACAGGGGNNGAVVPRALPCTGEITGLGERVGLDLFARLRVSMACGTSEYGYSVYRKIGNNPEVLVMSYNRANVGSMLKSFESRLACIPENARPRMQQALTKMDEANDAHNTSAVEQGLALMEAMAAAYAYAPDGGPCMFSSFGFGLEDRVITDGDVLYKLYYDVNNNNVDNLLDTVTVRALALGPVPVVETVVSEMVPGSYGLEKGETGVIAADRPVKSPLPERMEVGQNTKVLGGYWPPLDINFTVPGPPEIAGADGLNLNMNWFRPYIFWIEKRIVDANQPNAAWVRLNDKPILHAPYLPGKDGPVNDEDGEPFEVVDDIANYLDTAMPIVKPNAGTRGVTYEYRILGYDALGRKSNFSVPVRGTSMFSYDPPDYVLTGHVDIPQDKPALDPDTTCGTHVPPIQLYFGIRDREGLSARDETLPSWIPRTLQDADDYAHLEFRRLVIRYGKRPDTTPTQRPYAANAVWGNRVPAVYDDLPHRIELGLGTLFGHVTIQNTVTSPIEDNSAYQFVLFSQTVHNGQTLEQPLGTRITVTVPDVVPPCAPRNGAVEFLKESASGEEMEEFRKRYRAMQSQDRWDEVYSESDAQLYQEYIRKLQAWTANNRPAQNIQVSTQTFSSHIDPVVHPKNMPEQPLRCYLQKDNVQSSTRDPLHGTWPQGWWMTLGDVGPQGRFAVLTNGAVNQAPLDATIAQSCIDAGITQCIVGWVDDMCYANENDHDTDPSQCFSVKPLQNDNANNSQIEPIALNNLLPRWKLADPMAQCTVGNVTRPCREIIAIRMTPDPAANGSCVVKGQKLTVYFRANDPGPEPQRPDLAARAVAASQENFERSFRKFQPWLLYTLGGAELTWNEPQGDIDDLAGFRGCRARLGTSVPIPENAYYRSANGTCSACKNANGCGSGIPCERVSKNQFYTDGLGAHLCEGNTCHGSLCRVIQARRRILTPDELLGSLVEDNASLPQLALNEPLLDADQEVYTDEPARNDYVPRNYPSMDRHPPRTNSLMTVDSYRNPQDEPTLTRDPKLFDPIGGGRADGFAWYVWAEDKTGNKGPAARIPANVNQWFYPDDFLPAAPPEFQSARVVPCNTAPCGGSANAQCVKLAWGPLPDLKSPRAQVNNAQAQATKITIQRKLIPQGYEDVAHAAFGWKCLGGANTCDTEGASSEELNAMYTKASSAGANGSTKCDTGPFIAGRSYIYLLQTRPDPNGLRPPGTISSITPQREIQIPPKACASDGVTATLTATASVVNQRNVVVLQAAVQHDFPIAPQIFIMRKSWRHGGGDETNASEKPLMRAMAGDVLPNDLSVIPGRSYAYTLGTIDATGHVCPARARAVVASVPP